MFTAIEEFELDLEEYFGSRGDKGKNERDRVMIIRKHVLKNGK